MWFFLVGSISVRQTFSRFAFQIIFVLSLLSVSANLLAEDSYRYSLAGSYADIDLVGQAEGESWDVEAAVYLEPVSLDGTIPYTLTPFYTRTSAISFESNLFKYRGFRIVMASGVLAERKGESFAYSVHLAKKEWPVWANITATKVGVEERRFTNGHSPKLDSRYIYDAKIGWFVGEYVSLNALYSQDKDLKNETLGLAIDGLIGLGEYGFISAKFDYQEDHAESRRIELDVVRGAVRNLDVSPVNNDEEWGLALSYFLSLATEFGVARREFSDDKNIRDASSMSYYGSYFLTTNLKIGLSYLKYEAGNYRVGDLIFDYEQLKADISYRF